MSDRVRILNVDLLSDNWGILNRTTYEYRGADGAWQRHTRETYNRGNGAVILLYNRARRTVILVRQFRFPVYVNGGGDALLIEACAGLLDEDAPEDAIRREAEEETGCRVHDVVRVFDAYMSPGSVTEKLYFFVGEYDPVARAAGGGNADEGEDIEVLELPFTRALDMIKTGEIADGKTIMLLYHAQVSGLFD